MARRAGRSRVSSGVLIEEPSGSAGKGSTARPQSSDRGGGWEAEVEEGADLFEHVGPEQGFGRGACGVEVIDPAIFPRASSPIVGRSLGWSQLAAVAEPGANKLIARNVNDAPTNARASGFGVMARMD